MVVQNDRRLIGEERIEGKNGVKARHLFFSTNVIISSSRVVIDDRQKIKD